MYLKRFRGSNVREALQAVRAELGPRALVLSTAEVPAGGWRGLIGTREVEITAAAERDMSDLRLWESDERQEAVDVARTPVRPDYRADVVARLTAAGLDEITADEIAMLIPPRNRRGASLHSLRAALASRLSTLAAADAEYAPVEVFVGPPGAGKTTTIAKIASQERAKHGRRLQLVAADTFRMGGIEQLRLYAEVIGSSFSVARSVAELDSTLGTPHQQPVLVDTAGRSPADADARELFRLVAGRRDVRTHLVIPAGTPASAASRIFDAFEGAKPDRIVLTKLDETESLSPLVGVLRERRLPVSYLGTGQRVPEDLNRASAQLLAASVLGDTPSAWATQS